MNDIKFDFAVFFLCVCLNVPLKWCVCLFCYINLLSFPFYYYRIILVQNAPEKIVPPPSPTLAVQIPNSSGLERCSQVVANIESSPRIHDPTTVPSTGVGGGRPVSSVIELTAAETGPSRTDTPTYDQFSDGGEVRGRGDEYLRIDMPFDPLELNIQEMLALDIENSIRR